MEFNISSNLLEEFYDFFNKIRKRNKFQKKEKIKKASKRSLFK